MGMTVSIQSKHLFYGPLPSFQGLVEGIPSKYILSFLGIISDKLEIDGDGYDTQMFLLDTLTINVNQRIKNNLLKKAGQLLRSGEYELFSLPFLVEFANRELINYREGERAAIPQADIELNFIMAYLAIVDEMTERDTKILVEANQAKVELGVSYLERIFWPHIIKQYEFTNKPDPIYERYRGRALMAYIENQSPFRDPVIKYFKSLGCESGADYLNVIDTLIVQHLKRKPSSNPNDYVFSIRVSRPEPVINSLVISPTEVRNNTKKQVDYRGLKERPIIQFSDSKFIIPFWNFLYGTYVTGLMFSLYQNSEIKNMEPRFDTFKSKINEQFSERILFRGIMRLSFPKEVGVLKFFDDGETFNPDAYLRIDNCVFVFEFKDYLLNSDIIHSGSYDKISGAIDSKFIGSEAGKKKGVTQLADNIKFLTSDDEVFWTIDPDARDKGISLKDITVYANIVQPNIYFDLPGINDYLDRRYQELAHPSKDKVSFLSPLTMIHFHYFFDRALLFADKKIFLANELDAYHSILLENKKRAEKTKEINDWMQGQIPFSYYNSPEFRTNFKHRRGELLPAIEEAWHVPNNPLSQK